jgi:hypothetical protein
VELLFELACVLANWRLLVCLVPAILIACLIHGAWPEATWPYFFTVPIGLGCFIWGLLWEAEASSRS